MFYHSIKLSIQKQKIKYWLGDKKRKTNIDLAESIFDAILKRDE